MAREPSRVVKGNVRFCGKGESLHVNMWFRDRDELQTLIDALTELRDAAGNQSDHLHLQHYDLAAEKGGGLAEINFFRPGREISDLDAELIKTAAASLRQV
jgi:hypothetical protein